MWYHTHVTWIFGFHSSLILLFIFLSNYPRMGEGGYGSSVLITRMLLSYMTLVLISDLTAFSTTFVLRTLVSMGMVSSATSSYKFPLLSSPVLAQVACVAIHRFSCPHLTSSLYGCDGKMNFSAYSSPYSSNFLSSSHTSYFLPPMCVIYSLRHPQ